MSLSTIECQQIEVRWYRSCGRYQDRIATDVDGKPYVIGDMAWNKFHLKGRPKERVEFEMAREIELRDHGDSK